MDCDEGVMSTSHQTGLGMNCLLSPKYRHAGPGLTSPQEYNQWLPYRHDASLLPMKEDLAFWLNTMMGETLQNLYVSVKLKTVINTSENIVMIKMFRMCTAKCRGSF